MDQILLPVVSPETQGVCSHDLLSFVKACEQNDLQIASMVLLRNHKSILQFWKSPYESNTIQLLFSLSKTFTAAGVGIAADHKFIRIEDPVISFFPQDLPNTISANLAKMKIRHLLSMTCGIHDNTYYDLVVQEDWIKAFLSQDFPHEPGTFFRYSTHATYMLAAIVEKATGISFHTFLKKNLFEPLGIEDSTWEVCQRGFTVGGMGLGLTTDSVAKFGQMLLDNGRYDGKQILSRSYVSAMTTEQADNRKMDTGDHINGYGYQMHIDHDGSFYHPGGFGMLCYVSPKTNTVLAVTSRRNNWNDVMNLYHSHVLDRLHSDPRSCSAEAETLADYLETLAFPVPNQVCGVSLPLSFMNVYSMGKNDGGIQEASIYSAGDDVYAFCQKYSDREDSKIQFSLVRQLTGRDVFIKDIQYHRQKYRSYAVMKNVNCFELTIFYIETPYEVTYRLVVDGKQLQLDFQINGCMTMGNYTAEGYRA